MVSVVYRDGVDVDVLGEYVGAEEVDVSLSVVGSGG